jgi:glyoxylase-like metal-dependent hydrolase (beta-lactamase superfamily II)
LAALRSATGARAYADPIEAQAIAAGRASREIKTRGLLRFARAIAAPLFKTAPAVVDECLTGGQVLPISGGLQVIATPGHTPGHLSFFLPAAGILFAGDSLASSGGTLNGFIGANTWDVEKAKASVRLQAALGAKTVCVAHGSVVTDAAGKFPKV